MRYISRIGRNKILKKQRKKRLITAFLVISLLSMIFIPSFALSADTPKEEVVYVNLNYDGSVDATYVVNIFDLTEDGQIIDYGDYTALRQLTDSGTIEMENERIKIDAKAGKLFYEGKLGRNSIPWLFNIRYFLDGVEYKASDLGGKSGPLEICMNIDENKDAKNEFFKHFTLQVAFSFDGYTCKEIKAEGATIANAGKYKQVMFTVLPGKSTEIRAYAQVSDFEMEGISINAIPMNMDFTFEDDPDMMKKLKELKDGVAELDDGAVELRDGVKELRDGTEELKDGLDEFNEGVFELADGTGELEDNSDEFVDGVKELKDGVKDLYKGTREFKKGTKELNDGASDLLSAARKLYSGSNDLSNGLAQLASQNTSLLGGAGQIFDFMIQSANDQIPGRSLTRENYKDVLNGMIQPMEEGVYSAVMADIDAITDQVKGLVYAEVLAENPQATSDEIMIIMASQETADRIEGEVQRIVGEKIRYLLSANPSYVALYTLREQLLGFEEFYMGLTEYTGGVSSIASGAADLSSGLRSFRKGVNELRDGTGELSDGAIELHDGVIELKDGVVKLLDGAIELSDGIIKLNDGVIELKDGVIELFDGAIELHDGVLELYDGTVTMAEGTFKFRDKTKNIEKDLKDTIKEKIDDMLGRNFKPLSFVSDKNTNVEAVQFIMQTDAIEKAQPPRDTDLADVKITLMDRIRALFKISK